jgi:hypothetical protein
VNFSRLRLGIGFAVMLSVASATVGLAQTGSAPLPPPPVPTANGAATLAPVPPPTPGAPTAAPSLAPVPTPEPTTSSRPRRGRRAPGPTPSPGSSASASPSDTPEPPQFTTLDGVWEVEMQPMGQRLALYTHIEITTTGADIKGYWEHDPHKTRSPMTGTFDGRLISMTITLPDGTKPTFNGYVESFGDMVGIYHATDTDAGTAFTAQHRKKLKI